MTDAETNKKLFRLLGWEFGSFVIRVEGACYSARYQIKSPDGKGRGALPNPCQDWPDFKKYVLEEMRGQERTWGKENDDCVDTVGDQDSEPYTKEMFFWCHPIRSKIFESEIINNEILRAGVEAMIKYLEGK